MTGTGRLRDFKVHFRDQNLLRRVFIHSSYVNEQRDEYLESNERLEFLGDAILSAIISHILFERFPEKDEGELTKLRARLVNRRTLARLARDLDLGRYILMGKGEMLTGGRENPSILAATFEALIAGIYMDRGFKRTYSFVEGLFLPLIDESVTEPGHFDFKPGLQELTQRLYRVKPVYRLIRESGPPHRKTFEVEVRIRGEVAGRGIASSKKEAEQKAAQHALRRLRGKGLSRRND